ncbi:MAG: hypothetical protein ACLPVF_15520 [Acidimicrobiales bacterium]
MPADEGEAVDEVHEMKEQPARRVRARRTRSVIAWVLVVLVSIMLPLSVMTVWAVNTTTNTDRYVETLAPIAKNPVIIDNVSARVTNELFSSLDVQKKIASTLPKKADFIAAPLTSTLHQFVGTQVHRLLSSKYFYEFWTGALRISHTSMINVLSGKQTKASKLLKNGNAVAIKITPVVDKAIAQADSRGIYVFDPLKKVLSTEKGHVSLVLLTPKQVQKAQGLYNFVLKVKWLIPAAMLLLSALGVAVAVRRRKTLLRMSIGGAIGILVFLTALDLVRRVMVKEAVSNGFNSQSTGILFDTLVRFLRNGLWVVLAVDLVLAVILWFVGPARYAVAARRGIARAWHWLTRNVALLTDQEHRAAASGGSKKAAGWISEHRSGLRMLGALVAALFIIFGGDLSFGGVVVILLVLVVYLGLIQLAVAWAGRVEGEDAPPVVPADDGVPAGSGPAPGP